MIQSFKRTRAIGIKSNDWVYGYFLPISENEGIIAESFERKEDGTVFPQNRADVYCASICMSTGKLDSFDNLVWEKDRIEVIKNRKQLIVVYDSVSACFILYEENNSFFPYSKLSGYRKDEFHVIGNLIYDRYKNS